jgi:CheY-like chemotaxis protein
MFIITYCNRLYLRKKAAFQPCSCSLIIAHTLNLNPQGQSWPLFEQGKWQLLGKLLLKKPEPGNIPNPLIGCRVLVVEDEPMVALAIGNIVTELGGNVSAVASRPDQAYLAIEEQKVDCAILDVNLTGTLSFKIAAALRRHDIPFFYCTAHADAASVFPPIAAAPRLRKPVKKEELRDTLLHVLTAART